MYPLSDNHSSSQQQAAAFSSEEFDFLPNLSITTKPSSTTIDNDPTVELKQENINIKSPLLNLPLLPPTTVGNNNMNGDHPHQLTEHEQEGAFKHLLQLSGNEMCADCGQLNPTWASTNLGVFICITCSGCHRQMGTHISKVKSISLDRWNSVELRQMETFGNKNVNDRASILMRGRGLIESIEPNCTREERMNFIVQKYHCYHSYLSSQSMNTNGDNKSESANDSESANNMLHHTTSPRITVSKTPNRRPQTNRSDNNISMDSLVNSDFDSSFVTDSSSQFVDVEGVGEVMLNDSWDSTLSPAPSSNILMSPNSISKRKERGLISRAKSFVERRRGKHRRSQSSTEIGMVEFQGILVINLKRGYDLSARDPYCKIWTGPNPDNPSDLFHGQLMKSKVVKKCSNPEWNETLTCCVCNIETDALFIKCKDADRVAIKNEHVRGTKSIPLVFLSKSSDPVHNIRVSLDGVKRGEIELEISYQKLL